MLRMINVLLSFTVSAGVMACCCPCGPLARFNAPAPAPIQINVPQPAPQPVVDGVAVDGKKKPEGKKDAKVGEDVSFKDSIWQVLSVDDKGMSLSGPLKTSAKTDGKFIMVHFRVANQTKKEERLPGGLKLIDSEGREYQQFDRQNSFIPEGTKTIILEAIPAGLPKEFYAIYEIPPDAKGLRLQVRELKTKAPTFKLIDLGL